MTADDMDAIADVYKSLDALERELAKLRGAAATLAMQISGKRPASYSEEHNANRYKHDLGIRNAPGDCTAPAASHESYVPDADLHDSPPSRDV